MKRYFSFTLLKFVFNVQSTRPMYWRRCICWLVILIWFIQNLKQFKALEHIWHEDFRHLGTVLLLT